MLDHLTQRSRRFDALVEATESLSLRSWIPGRFEFTAPWGIRVTSRLGWFYLAAGQACLVQVEGHEVRVSLAAGDLIVVPQGRAHVLRDGADSPTTPIQDLLGPHHFERREPVLHGGGGALTQLFCGCFLLDGLERTPLYAALPPVIHIKGERRQPLPYVDHIVCLMGQEAASEEPCAQAVVNRLVRILLIKAVSGYMSELPQGNANWLGALADADIGRALGLMHAQPDAPWTVASLAKQVAVSRSTFSARFRKLVGKPPVEYLTEWRMQKAGSLLRTTRAGVKEVAAQVGYDSAAAFSKAFTHWAGTAPGAYRRASYDAAASHPARMPPI